MTTIASAWVQYRERVIAANAPPAVVTACERAFFAGATDALVILAEHRAASPAGVVPVGLVLGMRAIRDEVRAKIEAVAAYARRQVH